MGLVIHLLLTLALLCIRASAAAAAAAPAPSSLPRCRCLSRLSENENTTCAIDNNTKSLTLFNQSFLSLSPTRNSSSSFTFTSDFTFTTPSLAFILVPSPPPEEESPLFSPLHVHCFELSFNFTIQSCRNSSCPNSANVLPLDFCDSRPPQLETSNCSCGASADTSHSFKFSVSLVYDADAAALSVQAVGQVPTGEINQNFTFRILPQYREEYDRDMDGNMTLLVGYITQGGTHIKMTANADTMSSASSSTAEVDPPSQHENPSKSNHTKSNHTKVVVWVLVVVSTVVALIGLLVLALSLKRYHARLSSRPARHVAPSSMTTGVPSPPPPHHWESGATPMMRGHPLSFPLDTNDFQMSGTATWLKQPNAR